MPGGLIQIMSYGADDLYLTGAPQITMFKAVYRRYTNFAKESMIIPMGAVDFGKEVQIEILHTGDLLSNTYIQFDIPQVHILRSSTVADLTPQELDDLERPRPVSSQTDHISNYALIKKFMALNMLGYQKALIDSRIQNQSAAQYIASILDSIQTAVQEPDIFEEYHNIVDAALKYELERLQSNKNTENDLRLKYNDTVSKTTDPNVLNSLKVEYMENIEKLLNEKSNIYKNISQLDSKFSDITSILQELQSYINQGNGTNIFGFINIPATVQDVFKLVTTALKASQNVADYFFKKSQEAVNLTNDSNSLYSKFAWVEKLGLAMIDYVEVKIGGETIDKHYSDWINIWNELTGSQDQIDTYNKMIGNVRELTTFDRNPKPAYTLFIPLSFWFCRRSGLAFPMIALQFNKFYINVKLRNIEDCAYIEKPIGFDETGNLIDFTDKSLPLTDIWDNSNLQLAGNLLADFVYLEEQERKRFARSAHEYLIEVVERNHFEFCDGRLYELNLNGPSKELVWIFRKNEYTNNTNSHLISRWFNYTCNIQESNSPLLKAKLLFHGYDRFDKTTARYAKEYFNYVEPHKRHTRTPDNGIYSYSFALFPEDHQPTGTCNFTRINLPNIKLTVDPCMFQYKLSDVDPSIERNSELDETLSTDVNLTVFSFRYHVLRVISGMAAFAFY
jgi:hypothetical protein